MIEDQDETTHILQEESWRILDLNITVCADEKIYEKEVNIKEIEVVADSIIAALEAKFTENEIK